MEQIIYLPPIRTTEQIYNDIKTADSNSAISLNYIKGIIRKYNIPYATSGNKKMYNEKLVFDYINKELSLVEEKTTTIVPAKVRKQV
mgnify:FL=1